MTNGEAVNWIINISADIGKAEHRDLWHYEQALSEIRDMLESVQPEQRWIPCSERLPEVGKEVLVCYDFKGHRSVQVGNLYSDEEFHGYDDEYLTVAGRKYRKAVAWMPLPEPYREEGDE